MVLAPAAAIARWRWAAFSRLTLRKKQSNVSSILPRVASSRRLPNRDFWEDQRLLALDKYLILLVGAPRFELGTPSPPVSGHVFLAVACVCLMLQKLREMGVCVAL